MRKLAVTRRTHHLLRAPGLGALAACIIAFTAACGDDEIVDPEARYSGVHLCTPIAGASPSQTGGPPSSMASRSPRPTDSPSSPAPQPAGALGDEGARAPYFSQTDAAWGGQEYDHGARQGVGCGSTIAQCGCAMTSVATVLRLFEVVTTAEGSDLNPGTLNEWFNRDARLTNGGWVSQGYLYGNVVWPAVNTLSAEVAAVTPGVPKVSFSVWGDDNLNNVRAALIADRPVVLEVPGHFVAAVGVDGDEILINDPMYRDRTSASAYEGRVRSTRYFEATDDSSGILIGVPANLRVRVIDANGNQTGTLKGGAPDDVQDDAKEDIPRSAYRYEEAWRDPTCSERPPPDGAGVNTIFIPTPDKGAFEIEVVNPQGGDTTVAIHAIDEAGKLTLLTRDSPRDNKVTLDYDSAPDGEIDLSGVSDVKPDEPAGAQPALDLNGTWNADNIQQTGQTWLVEQSGNFVAMRFADAQPGTCKYAGQDHHFPTISFLTGTVSGRSIEGVIWLCQAGEAGARLITECGIAPLVTEAVRLSVDSAANSITAQVGRTYTYTHDTDASGRWTNCQITYNPGFAGTLTMTRAGCELHAPDDYGLPPDAEPLTSYGALRAYRKDGSVEPVADSYVLDPDRDLDLRRVLGNEYTTVDDAGGPAPAEFSAGFAGIARVIDGSDFRTIALELASGNILYYLFASEIRVEDGDEVEPSTVLGQTGDLGDGNVGLHVQVRSPEGRPLHPFCTGEGDVGGVSVAPGAPPSDAPDARACDGGAAEQCPLSFRVGASCPGIGQTCSQLASQVVSTGAVLEVEFTASGGHCSDIGVYVAVDAGEPKFFPRLAPGASTGSIDFGPVSPGSHTITVQALGIEGGCNGGDIGSWSGTLIVTTAADRA